MTAEELINLALDADKIEDFQTSFNYYKQAAEMGSVYAMLEVAGMYLRGTGVAKNEVEGFNWLKKAAELKNPSAMAMLGRMYELGIGVESDIHEALKWYVDAANAGEEHAQQRLKTVFTGLGKS